MDKEIIICKINDVEGFFEEGTTIFEAARSLNIDIPALCYHPELTITGSCRLCVVEIEGEKLLFPACSTPLTNNMVIYTHSKRVLEARRVVIEMILSQHLADCLTCDASGNCLLEKYSYELGATGNYFQKSTLKESKVYIEDNNPFIRLDRTKCILCGKCIRACNEWSHRDALTFVDKGDKMVVSTLYDKGLEANKECIFCGNCISVCPVGALWEKDAVGKGRFPDLKMTKTVCPYCGVGCGLEVYQKDGKIVYVRGDDQSPVSKGRLCIKGKFGLDFVNSDERLKNAYIKREDGEFEEVELLDALIHIKNKIDEVRKKEGKFAGLASARCTNEDNYVFQKFFRSVLQTDDIDHCARICHAPTVSGLRMTLGSGAMTNPIEDIEHMDCFLIIGSNMTNTHPVISWKVIDRLKQGAILILVDPKKSDLVQYATLHLQIDPGADMAFLYAMIKMIIEEDMFDRDMVENRTEGFDEFVEQLNEFSLDELISMSGIDENDIRLAARLYAISGASGIYYAMGITQHIFGTGNVVALANLAVLCGKVGTGFTGINPLRGQNNVQGACDMGGLPGLLPGYQDILDKEVREKFENAWGCTLPTEKGLTLTEIIKAAGDKEIDFLYIMGENPMISDPDVKSVEKSLTNAPFVVVQDIFFSETAQFADVVLPACSFAEKDGTFTNTERRVQRVRKITNPPSEQVMEDWQIIQRIAELFDSNFKYNSWIDIFNEMRRLTPSFSHIEPQQIGEVECFWPGNLLGESVKRLHQDEFSRGKAKLIYMKPELPYQKTEEYPFLLIIGRLYEHYHSGNMTRKSKGIEHIQPEARLFINPKDAIRFRLKDDDPVKLISEKGEVTIKCQLNLDVKPGNLYVSFHFREVVVNLLTSKDKLDEYSKMPGIKVTPVRIEL